MTVELTVTATRTREGKAGFKVPIVEVELGGGGSRGSRADDRKRNIQCVGVAAADNPRGPFRDTSETPLVCQPGEGGTIDANPFRDADGKLYLYYKSDGNAVRKTSYIWGQRLSDDGLKVVGPAARLIKDDAKWEWGLVEAPAMVRSSAARRRATISGGRSTAPSSLPTTGVTGRIAAT